MFYFALLKYSLRTFQSENVEFFKDCHGAPPAKPFVAPHTLACHETRRMRYAQLANQSQLLVPILTRVS